MHASSSKLSKKLKNGIDILVRQVKTCGATQNPKFPRTGPKPVRGLGIFLRIFSGRVGSSREFYFGSVRVGVFLTRVWDISSREFGDKLAFHSQTDHCRAYLRVYCSLKLDLKLKSLISTQKDFPYLRIFGSVRVKTYSFLVDAKLFQSGPVRGKYNRVGPGSGP